MDARAVLPQTAEINETSGVARALFRRFSILGFAGGLIAAAGGFYAGALPFGARSWLGAPEALAAPVPWAAAVFAGVAILSVAWLRMGQVLNRNSGGAFSSADLIRVCLLWSAPLLVTAPLFSRDIYSYLAQGAMVRHGFDAYALGPADAVGLSDELVGSVPDMWAHAPSPYGPVALGLNAAISWLTQDTVVGGVFAHRLVAICALLLAAWAVRRLALRSCVAPEVALWLGVLNPLVLIHGIGGMHNEAAMMALLLVGLELCFAGIDALKAGSTAAACTALLLSALLLSLAGLVKVTAFAALGFSGMALARTLRPRLGTVRALCAAGALQATLLVATSATISHGSGLGFGWIASQGGAAFVHSFLSLSTNIGVALGWVAQTMGFGAAQEFVLTFTRVLFLALAAVVMWRALWAVFRDAGIAVKALGCSFLALVAFSPVVLPWYFIWALMPLATQVRRTATRWMIAGLSVALSCVVFPQGEGQPVAAAVAMYSCAAAVFCALAAATQRWILSPNVNHRRQRRGLD